MGGRGASSGFSVKGNPYGSQYRALFVYGAIKFVEQSKDGTEPLMETRTKGRIYVEVVTVTDKRTGAEKKVLNAIYYFDSNLKRLKSIDLRHSHQKMKPHTHHGYVHNENDGPKGATALTSEERQMVDTVYKLWDNYLAGRGEKSSTR